MTVSARRRRRISLPLGWVFRYFVALELGPQRSFLRGLNNIARKFRPQRVDGEMSVAAKRRAASSARLARCGGQGVVLIAEMGREPGAAAGRGVRSPAPAPLDPVSTTVPAV